jgi:alpha-L-fucosidase
MLTFLTAVVGLGQAGAVEPLHPVPSPRQLAWHRLRTYAFVHFGPNTFTGEEWGHGTERPETFHPRRLDCRQWVRTFQRAGLKGVIITAKHHDGFCLWPSKFSSHTVAQSRWRRGKGDVLRDLSEACRAEGLKFGVYLSPWDRNHPTYGSPQYNDVFVSMLREVLTGYGPVFEVWFDGANGEGPNGKRQVYDWPRFVQTVRECQPEAVIFSDAGPDVRWVGNEQGFASDPNWATLNRERFEPGKADQNELTLGHEGGKDWVPAECDVSIRPGWFWRASEDGKVKSLEDLMSIYYGSVGQGASLLLNVPPNADGRISEPDVARLVEFRKRLDAEFSKPLRPIRVFGESVPGYEAENVTDEREESFGASSQARNGSVELELTKGSAFNRVALAEPVQLGQRVRRFQIDIWDGAAWREIYVGDTIGPHRILRLARQETDRVRVSVLDARDRPLLSEVRLFLAPPAKV